MLQHFFFSSHFALFLLAALVLAITPGPGILYVLARTLSGGRPEGLASILGTTAGGLLHVVLAALGLSALLAASAKAFLLIKFLGAAYLIFLGIRSVLQARRAAAPVPVSGARAHGTRRAFLEGILTEALNVKTALFFIAFIPQFIDHSLAPAPQFAVLGLICLALNFLVDLCVVLLAMRLTTLFKSSARPARLMQYGSGSVLLGLGVYLALADSRH